MVKMEDAPAQTQGQGQQTDKEDREFIKPSTIKGKTLRELKLEGARTGENRFGKFGIVLAHDSDGESLSIMCPQERSVWGVGAFNTLTYEGNDTYRYVHDNLMGKWIWIASVPKTSKSTGYTYYDFSWGFESNQDIQDPLGDRNLNEPVDTTQQSQIDNQQSQGQQSQGQQAQGQQKQQSATNSKGQPEPYLDGQYYDYNTSPIDNVLYDCMVNGDMNMMNTASKLISDNLANDDEAMKYVAKVVNL